MSADWTTARVVRDRDGKHALRIDDLPDARNFWTRGGFNMTGDALNLHYGPLTPILDAEGLPDVRTVGDLTERKQS